jgi:Carboxypeptidase regulatory-like domain
MRLSKRMLAAVLIFLAAEYPVYAQSQLGTGALSGTVQDAGGAVVIGAKVTVTNDDTDLTRTSATNEAGQFTVPVLPVGAYTVRVTQTGFAAAEQKGLIVNVGGTTTMRVELKPGAIDEVVNITAGAQIDSSRTEEVSLINRMQINNLPINGRRAN